MLGKTRAHLTATPPNEAVIFMTEAQETTGNEARSATTTGGISMRIIGAVSIIIAILLAFYAFSLAGSIADLKTAAEDNETRYIACNQAINELQAASDYLTTQARMYVNTGRQASMDSYVHEINSTNRRGRAVNTLKSSFEKDQGAAAELEEALAASDELAKKELVAMKLAANYYQTQDVPDLVANTTVDSSLKNLSPNDSLQTAKDMVLGKDYDRQKEAILANVKASSDALLEALNKDLDENNSAMQSGLFQLRISVALLLCVVMVLVLVLLMYVLKPLSRYIKRIQSNEPLDPDGAYELQYLANAYNTMYEDNNKRIEQLREFAERDPLTGISNRSGYDNFLAKHTRNIALLLIDIDNFKEFNTVYGRDTGDAVLVKLAQALSTAFRSTDFPCRIYGDRFAVIMTNTNANLREAVSTKIDLVNSILADDSDDLPLVTLSVGAAFSTEGMNDRDIYQAASEALDQAHENGRNGIAFYGENN